MMHQSNFKKPFATNKQFDPCIMLIILNAIFTVRVKMTLVGLSVIHQVFKTVFPQNCTFYKQYFLPFVKQKCEKH